MPWEEFKRHGVYKFKLDRPHVAFQDQIEKGVPFQTPSGKIEILCTELAQINGLDEDHVRLPYPVNPEMDRALGIAEQPEDSQISVSSDLAASALAHSFDLQQLPLVA